MPTVVEFTQSHLDGQGTRVDTWPERFTWIVDTFEDGAINEKMAREKFGRSDQGVRNLCSTTKNPSGETLAKVIESYPDVNPHYLLTGEGARKRTVENGSGRAVVDDVTTDVAAELGRIRAEYGLSTSSDEALDAKAKAKRQNALRLQREREAQAKTGDPESEKLAHEG